MKILYVVHRYAPFPGGSENYVRDMAEETLSRGHDVTVFAGEHKGDLNGVKVTSDTQILLKPFDLIVVHGGDVAVQNFVLANAKKISSPILYLLILPSKSTVCLQALQDCKYLGWSTLADQRHLKEYNVEHKGIQVRHGINLKSSIGTPGFKKKYGITAPYMYLSCGGYWPNKAMAELSQIFNNLKYEAQLVLTGYDNRNNLMPAETEYVKPLLIKDREDVMSAISEADLYILHSYSEGFGLVLLESMVNNTPWVARNIAGAETMEGLGFTYSKDTSLIKYLDNFGSDRPKFNELEKRKYYVLTNHLIKNTVDDILNILK